MVSWNRVLKIVFTEIKKWFWDQDDRSGPSGVDF